MVRKQEQNVLWENLIGQMSEKAEEFKQEQDSIDAALVPRMALKPIFQPK